MGRATDRCRDRMSKCGSTCKARDRVRYCRRVASPRFQPLHIIMPKAVKLKAATKAKVAVSGISTRTSASGKPIASIFQKRVERKAEAILEDPEAMCVSVPLALSWAVVLNLASILEKATMPATPPLHGRTWKRKRWSRNGTRRCRASLTSHISGR